MDRCVSAYTRLRITLNEHTILFSIILYLLYMLNVCVISYELTKCIYLTPCLYDIYTIYTAPRSDVHSQQRFFYMGHAGEVTVDQAHRGYSVSSDAAGYKSVNPLFMKVYTSSVYVYQYFSYPTYV